MTFLKDPAATYRQCVDALKDFVYDEGFTDVVIGLSGGIDSALVAVMAVDAFGPEHVHAVMMPGPFSSTSSIDDSVLLGTNLDLELMTMSIDEPYRAFAKVFADGAEDLLSGLAAENTQARCRMVFVMALSNQYGWMMLNTGNKSEAAMGYSTLYGDTAGAYAPIGGLYKTDVFELSRWRNEQSVIEGKHPVIPETILVKPPSAELSPKQSDEKSMGIAYAELDPILIELVEHGRDISEVASMGYDKSKVEMVAKRYASYAFKRALEPDFTRIDY